MWKLLLNRMNIPPSCKSFPANTHSTVMWFVGAVGYFHCTVLLHACSFCILVKFYNVIARRHVRASAKERTPPAQYRPLHGIRHMKIRSSQCAYRGQKVNSIPLNCVLTREFLVNKKCLLVASWTVKIAPALESSFSGFLQDLIRLR